MARCQICNYCDTTGDSLDEVYPRSGRVQVRYYADTDKELCSVCSGHQYKNIVHYEDEFNGEEYWSKGKSGSLTVEPRRFEQKYYGALLIEGPNPEEDTAHKLGSDTPALSEV